MTKRSSNRLVPVFALGVVVAALAAAVFVPTSAGAAHLYSHLHPMVVFTGNGAGPVLQAINNGSGYGVEGDGTSSAGVIGTSNTGTGLVGISTNLYGISGSSTNNIGLNGDSTNGPGVGGSTQSTYPNAGVAGDSVSNSTSSSPVGVYGFVQQTGFGVVGDCVNSNVGSPTSLTTCHGVIGESLATQGVAVEAFGSNAAPHSSYTPAPVFEVDDFNGGPLINAFGSTGEVLTLDGSGNLSDFGSLSATSTNNNTVLGTSTNGIGVWGQGANFFGVAAEGTNTGTAFITQSDHSGLQMRSFSVAHGHDIMSLDDNGNMILSGTLTQSGSPLVARRHPANDGYATATYTATGTSPTIEDYGQAQIVGGIARVALDPKFAQTIDMRSPYLVFLTPEGDSNGFYVQGKTLAGFTIAENKGGHSSLLVDYRIVARPMGESGTRLAQMLIPLQGTRPHLVRPASMTAMFASMQSARPTISRHGLGTPTQWRPLSAKRPKF